MGTAGTVTTLAALEMNLFPYDPLKIHGTTLALDRVEGLFDQLCRMSLEQRMKLKPLEKGREDLIIAGTCLAFNIAASVALAPSHGIFGVAAATATAYALRAAMLVVATKRLTGLWALVDFTALARSLTGAVLPRVPAAR